MLSRYEAAWEAFKASKLAERKGREKEYLNLVRREQVQAIARKAALIVLMVPMAIGFLTLISIEFTAVATWLHILS